MCEFTGCGEASEANGVVATEADRDHRRSDAMTDFTDHQDRPILQACGIGKSFPGVRALHDVSLRLRAGRLLALLGENGAGKSTLMNVLSGVVVPDCGQILLKERPVRFAGPRDARAHGIATIFQELSLCGNLSVAENIFLGNEPRTRLGFIDRARMNRETRDLLDRMSLQVAPETPLELAASRAATGGGNRPGVIVRCTSTHHGRADFGAGARRDRGIARAGS